MSETEEVPRFDLASRVTRVGDRFRAEVPEGWQQGRGAFGGLSIGIAVRALEEAEPERAMRAVTAELPGPLMPGAAEIAVTSLRRGSGMSTLEATIVQEGETKARVSGVFGRARVADVDLEHTVDPGDWRAVEPLPPQQLGPAFARYFEYRLTGPLPFAGGDEPVVEGWTRPRAPLPRYGAAEVVAMADAYWPAIFSTTTAPRPMATVTYTLQILHPPEALDPEAPLFYRARMLAGRDGYVSELRELYTPEGRLVALNPQTFVVIK